jgi:radical SAM protein with 4Fe4S-binding SPASM domain
MKNILEVSTDIGCKVLCKYCPQSKVIERYKSNIKNMSFVNFKKILLNLDKDKTRLFFSGYSEFFLNPEAIDIIVYAYESGFQISFASTLIGLTKEKLFSLTNNKVSFECCLFHRAISSTMYDEKVFDEFVDFFIKNINMKFFKVFKVEDFRSRAGTLFEMKRKKGKHICATNMFNRNVVVPNGDLFLCCNDFGLNHKIGNLFEESYYSESILNNRKKISEAMNKEDSDIICRYCEFFVKDEKEKYLLLNSFDNKFSYKENNDSSILKNFDN